MVRAPCFGLGSSSNLQLGELLNVCTRRPIRQRGPTKGYQGSYTLVNKSQGEIGPAEVQRPEFFEHQEGQANKLKFCIGCSARKKFSVISMSGGPAGNGTDIVQLLCNHWLFTFRHPPHVLQLHGSIVSATSLFFWPYFR